MHSVTVPDALVTGSFLSKVDWEQTASRILGRKEPEIDWHQVLGATALLQRRGSDRMPLSIEAINMASDLITTMQRIFRSDLNIGQIAAFYLAKILVHPVSAK